MAVGRPVLFLGPKPSHVSDLIEQHQIGLAVEHGQVQACIDAIRDLQQSSIEQRARMGSRAQDAMRQGLSKPILLAKMADRVERLMSKHVSGETVPA
jgi:colanic acid biosynthesis glycosyl transferase WcaI